MSETCLSPQKLRTVAAFARLYAAHPADFPDILIARQMIVEGIRKLHDYATSARGRGKYKGHSHWSKDAVLILNSNGGIVSRVNRFLSHEHVVPVRLVVDRLLQISPNAPIEDFEIEIRRFSVVAIVTRDEEQLLREAGLRDTMPAGWNEIDVWARYRAVGLYENIVAEPHRS